MPQRKAHCGRSPSIQCHIPPWLRPLVERECRARSLPAECDDIVGHICLKYVQDIASGRLGAAIPQSGEADPSTQEKRLAAWLIKGVRNAITDRKRKQKRHPILRLSVAQQQAIQAPVASSPVDSDRRATIDKALTRLPGRQRYVATLRFEGLSVSEVASAIGCTTSAVRSLWDRARQALRQDEQLRELLIEK